MDQWLKSFLCLITLFFFCYFSVDCIETCDVPVIPAEENGIEGQYIVVFNEAATDDEVNELRKTMEGIGATVKHEYKRDVENGRNKLKFHGFAIKVDEKKSNDALEKAKKNCAVKHIEQDQVVKATSCSTQPNSGWCLAKIPEQNNQYIYPSSAGAGATVYVIDSGCNQTHPDLLSRIALRKNFISSIEGDDDYNGHGTCTASLVGGLSSGVAKSAKLVCAKALNKDGSGANSDVIAAVNWCASQPDYGIISMSLGGGKSIATNSAIQSAYESGHLPIVAAGNENKDASNVSPASSPNAITVAASDSTNNFASFSNFGQFIDVIAPGVSCNCAIASSNGIGALSGTSIATPLTAGVAAIIQAQNGWTLSSSSPQQITTTLLSVAKVNQVKKVPPKTVNKLLYWSNCN